MTSVLPRLHSKTLHLQPSTQTLKLALSFICPFLAYLSTHLHIHLSIYMSVHLILLIQPSTYLPIGSSMDLPIDPSTNHPPIYPSSIHSPTQRVTHLGILPPSLYWLLCARLVQAAGDDAGQWSRTTCSGRD